MPDKSIQPFISTIRVCYSDTDQMGFVHHSNYLKYYEAARWDLFRQLGEPYKNLEEKGFLLPVINVQVNVIKPAFYDEQLVIETTISAIKGAKLSLNYKLFNVEQDLINTAKITLGFVSAHSRKPCRPPEFFHELLQEYMKGFSDCMKFSKNESTN
jgi:acyl-CoA thioester hydrolase